MADDRQTIDLPSIGAWLIEVLDPAASRPGLADTPARFAKAWVAKTAGYAQDPRSIVKLFEPETSNVRGMCMVRDIEVESVCEHHLERIWGYAHIAYVPGTHVLGLSKFKRIVDVFARRLQVQERLTAEIADALQELLQPQGVGVVIEARHACMEVRGIQVRGQVTITSELRGCFYDDASTRSEFLALARASSKHY
jgi:GTP cyclohydrolase I